MAEHMINGYEVTARDYGTWFNMSPEMRALWEVQQGFSPGKSVEIADYKPKQALDIQEGGNHYKDMAIQPVEYITANNIPFMEGNVIKYVSRHMSKNGAQDIKKAIHFLELILQLRYPETK